jgi:hypothetical protein
MIMLQPIAVCFMAISVTRSIIVCCSHQSGSLPGVREALSKDQINLIANCNTMDRAKRASLDSDIGNLRAVLKDGVQEEGLDDAVCKELLRYLIVQRELDRLTAEVRLKLGFSCCILVCHSCLHLSMQAPGRTWPPRYPRASDLSPSQSMDKLLHWVLLNTEVRGQVEAALDTHIAHSTRTAQLPDEDKVERQLVTMNIMTRLGLPPQLLVWREPGTLMDAIRGLKIQRQNGEVSTQ